MRIEPLTQAGAPQVVALLDVLGYPTSVQQCRLRIERLLAQPDSAGWCAVDDDIIGIAAGRLQWMLKGRRARRRTDRARGRAVAQWPRRRASVAHDVRAVGDDGRHHAAEGDVGKPP